MPKQINPRHQPAQAVSAGAIVLLVLTTVMLLALLTRTPPHPPLETPLFALGPFLGASLAIGGAALYLLGQGSRHGTALVILFALTALVSFGPQKFLDPNLSRIWPTVVTAQAAVAVILVCGILDLRRRRP